MSRHHVIEYAWIALSVLLAPALTGCGGDSYVSPTEGVITQDFVPEYEMERGLLESLALFSQYISKDYLPVGSPNAENDKCGCFKGEKTMTSTEKGVRVNADLSMLCAFLVKYAKPLGISLPKGVTYERLEEMAMGSLVWAYSTHKAVRLKECRGGDYWGSVGLGDSKWESSLWAFSVAWSAFFQWDKLTDSQKEHIHSLIAAECEYELQRELPVGVIGDTKAEENGWEACVLAAALGLFPEDPSASLWFERMREFAVNSYSHPSDTLLKEPLDPWYNNQSVADLTKGANLFEDYTLQNHKYFHPSYLNVVAQELGEAALALQMFQEGLGKGVKWKSEALFHNILKVKENVIDYLALPDGEIAMPNGNDWSLFLFDQITSFSVMATFLRDPEALTLENMAYKNILARQSTTPDGSWLLRSDIGARRMGIQGHRVMMTYLMHLTASTEEITPARWEDFREEHSGARVLPCQNVVRASSPDRFAVFSYSDGLENCSGYISSNTPDKCKVFIPFRYGGTGNFIGWYNVKDKGQTSSILRDPYFVTEGNSFVTGSTILTNDNTLETSFAIYATPGNAVLYLDRSKAMENVTITGERGLVAGISMDEFTSLRRSVTFDRKGKTPLEKVLDGDRIVSSEGKWANVDGQVGLVVRSSCDRMAFGDRADNKSVMTAKLYGAFSDAVRQFNAGDRVGDRAAVYYTGISPETTAKLDSKLIEFENGIIATDPDGTAHMLIADFDSECNHDLVNVRFKIDTTLSARVPVFDGTTNISKSGGYYQVELQVSLDGACAKGLSTSSYYPE
ncbi:MAG: hypothetical protein K6F06_09910 [Bacteroidales bacterium]|nr:hypothetical protein [Bacteroidales bacterium]